MDRTIRIIKGKLIGPVLKTLRLGDKVEAIARPIAKVLGIPCHDEKGKLLPNTPCAGRKAKLNGENLYPD